MVGCMVLTRPENAGKVITSVEVQHQDGILDELRLTVYDTLAEAQAAAGAPGDAAAGPKAPVLSIIKGSGPPAAQVDPPPPAA